MPRLNPRTTARIAEVSAAQCGLITAPQLAEIGLSRDGADRRCLAGGIWRRVLPGVYSLAPGELDDAQRVTAALLYVRSDCALTGVTALRAADVRAVARLDDAPIHVLVPHRRRRSTTGFVVVERTTNWDAPATIGGRPTASLARAAVDASRRITSPTLTRALIAELVQTKRCSLDELVAELDRGQRRGTAAARQAVALLRHGPASAPEMRLFERWQESELPAAQWNAELFTAAGEFVARPDAFVAEAGLVIEVDSREFHYAPDDWDRTMRRDSRLTSLGLLVLHVTPRRIDDDWSGIEREVRSSLNVQQGRTWADLCVRSAA